MLMQQCSFNKNVNKTMWYAWGLPARHCFVILLGEEAFLDEPECGHISVDVSTASDVSHTAAAAASSGTHGELWTTHAKCTWQQVLQPVITVLRIPRCVFSAAHQLCMCDGCGHNIGSKVSIAKYIPWICRQLHHTIQKHTKLLC